MLFRPPLHPSSNPHPPHRRAGQAARAFFFQLLLIGFGYFIAAALPAQAYDLPDTVDLSVLRVVTDSFPVITTYFRAEKAGGGPMPTFRTRDLRILEDGVECRFNSLRSVAEQTPVHLAMVMDRSASMMDDFIYRFDTVRGSIMLSATAMRRPGQPYPFDQAKSAIRHLAQSMAMPRDGLLLVSFSDRVDPISPMRRDTATLSPSLGQLRATGSTAFYDAILAALDSLPLYTGLRAVVALTDGTDNASQATAADVLRRAQETQTPLYLVGLGNVARDTLIHLAGASRGACYFLDHGSLLEPVYRDISRRIRSVYVASYTSHNPPEPGHDYHVEVRLRGDTLCMRGHASRYQVPAHIAEAWSLRRNLQRAGIALALMLVGGVLAYLLLRRNRSDGSPSISQLPALPELLPPPRAFPNPCSGQLTVRIELSGDSPSAFLIVANIESQPLRQYQISGHQPWLDIDLSGLPDGDYFLRITDGHSISSPTKVVLLQ